MAKTYKGPVDLATLVDLDSLAVDGICHYTFFAFPFSMLNEHGLPSSAEAQRYLAAVQSAGVPIGIWTNSITDDTCYAAVTRENIRKLWTAIARLTQFSETYAASLCERLFREAGGEEQ